LGGPGGQVLAVAVAGQVGEVAARGLGGREFFASRGDLRQLGAVGVGEVAGG
jgi:hypothetical protein